jgi:hypothetical protein
MEFLNITFEVRPSKTSKREKALCMHKRVPAATQTDKVQHRRCAETPTAAGLALFVLRKIKPMVFQREFVMSMDFPDYEVIRTKSRWLAFVWMLGDRFHYIGLLGAIFIGLWAPINAFFSWLKGSQIGVSLFNIGGLAAFGLCLCLYSIGQPLKRHARIKAGIRNFWD